MRRWARARMAWPKAFALGDLAVVVGATDGVGSQGGEGGAEHGSLESLVAAVGDVLAADRGARPLGHGCQTGVGGQVRTGVEGAPEGLSDEHCGGPDPDPGHGGQDLVKRVGLHQGLDLGGDVTALGVQGDELARQVGQDNASGVGPRDGEGLLGQGAHDLLRP